MPLADPSFGWQEGIVAFGILLAVAFLVSWYVTDVLHIRRPAYVAILFTVVMTALAAYIAWSGTSARELTTSAWGWGLVTGVLAALIVSPLVRRLPARSHVHGAALARMFLWEGVVYGTAEAVLLAALPAMMLWQASADAGWSDGSWGKLGSGALAIAGALVVILVHHLGYAEFRRVAVRPKMVGALFSCGLQAAAFLLTGNVLAPVMAHILLHGQLIVRGVEMPPVREARTHVRAAESWTEDGTNGEDLLEPAARRDIAQRFRGVQTSGSEASVGGDYR
jgi:hypothetical protein